jgi:two-component system cell cycle sensor histidine kinase/response regulator CckA
MRDDAEPGNGTLRGDARTGAGIAAGGALLLVSTLSGLWSTPLVVPGALAIALLVFGGYLLSLRIRFFATLIGSRTGIARCFDGYSDPVWVTDTEGRVLGANPAAQRARLNEGLAAGAARYRLTREARLNGVAIEETEGGRVVVTRTGRRSLLWRIERDSRPPAIAPTFESADFPWLRVDAEGQVLECNRAATAIVEDGAWLDDILADPPFRPDGVHLLAATGKAVRAITLCRSDEGRRDLLLMPLHGAEISGLVPDHFLEDLPVALARLENCGMVTYANKAARQLLGETARPGTDIADLIEGLGRPIAERLADTARGRALGRSEIARLTGEGPEVFLQVAFTRTVLAGGSSILAVISDATELKTLEAQFVQSQKMQAVGQLAGGVAHDFNNLLTAINGHCDLLLMRHDVADVEHGDLMQIRQNANRAAALVRQLLAFSRKQTLRPTVINLQDTLSELTHLLNRLLTDKVALKIEHGPDLAPVRVDERQIEQVIMNLVVNARDAMPRGGEVRITTRNVRLARDLVRDRAVILKGDYVVIEVADSGHGIPEGKLTKIFEPFFTTKQVGDGTGLGLSTAYGIIKQTGGFIFADSRPDEGATFTIYLPAYDKMEAGPAPGGGPEVRRPRDLTGRGLVLLVEDEDPVRSFAARALRLRGYTVVEAASGEEALEILEDADLHVNLMLSDVIMPGLDGPGWVREAQKGRPGTKVIFMSGYAEDALVGGDGGVPGASFLQKPFTLNELTERVKDQLLG